MIGPTILLLVGLALSAFFSGSETGFYRVTRVRLVIDALKGDWIARGLLWLVNNPAMYVATTLVGNNTANYLTSLAVVMLTKSVAPGSQVVELTASVMFSPLVFVYGELLPKNLFYNMPNLLLRRAGPLFIVFAVLFAPVSAILWGLGRGLQTLLGEAPLRVQLRLARKEIRNVFREGQDAGILGQAQQHLAQSLFSSATKKASVLSKPLARVPSVRIGDSKSKALRLARRHKMDVLPVASDDGKQLAGYVRVIDLLLSDSEKVEKTRPLVKLKRDATQIEALIRLQSERQELAMVTDQLDTPIGLLFASELIDTVFRGD